MVTVFQDFHQPRRQDRGDRIFPDHLSQDPQDHHHQEAQQEQEVEEEEEEEMVGDGFPHPVGPRVELLACGNGCGLWLDGTS